MKRYWFLIGMTAAIGGGFVCPETSRDYQRSGLHVAVLAVNYVTATMITRDQPSRRSLMLCASQKTLATGSYVWARHFVVNPLGGIPLLFYHVVQLVFDSLLAHWLARQDANPGRSSHVS